MVAVAYSGLWDEVHGEPHALTAKYPSMNGILRAFMQKRGFYGYVRGSGRFAPATSKRVTTVKPSISARGVTITNMGGGIEAISDYARPATATAAQLSELFDTTLRHQYAGDLADHDETGKALTEITQST